MIRILSVYTLFLIVPILIRKTSPTPIIEYDKGVRYEEYKVEHEISATQARNAALHIDLKSARPAGCQTCTALEIKYCLGTDLINDHCCCDRRHHEKFPFIPHTCYEGPQVCKAVVGDCGEYQRLKSCCCDTYVLQKCKKSTGKCIQGKEKSASDRTAIISTHSIIAITLCIFL